MMRENVFFQGCKTREKALESQAKLFTAFILAVPAIMGNDWPIDLHTNGKIVRNCVRRKAVRVSARSNSRPSDIHA
jgi:hypothetical protein